MVSHAMYQLFPIFNSNTKMPRLKATPTPCSPHINIHKIHSVNRLLFEQTLPQQPLSIRLIPFLPKILPQNHQRILTHSQKVLCLRQILATSTWLLIARRHDANIAPAAVHILEVLRVDLGGNLVADYEW